MPAVTLCNAAVGAALTACTGIHAHLQRAIRIMRRGLYGTLNGLVASTMNVT